MDAGRIKTFGPEKLIDAELADAQWARNTRARVRSGDAETKPQPASGHIEGEPSEISRVSYDEARRRRELAEAERAELQLATMRGELVQASDIGAELSRVFASFREAMMQIPARVSAVLAAETDEARVNAVLTEEIRGALLQLKERSA